MMSQAAAAPTSKPKRITLALVQRECIVSKDAGAGAGAEALATQGASHDDVDDLDQLASLRTIDLSWQNIGPTPEGLDFLAGAQCHLRELYLQSNAITSIGDAFDLVGQSLELLSLSDNLIVELEGLSHLHKLRLLDLSNNRIDALDVRELPSRSLRILNLSGNPCMCPHSDGSIATDAVGGMGSFNAVGAVACRQAVIAHCSQIIELDQDPIRLDRSGRVIAEPTLPGGDVAEHEYVQEALMSLWQVTVCGSGDGDTEADRGARIDAAAYRRLHERLYWSLVAPVQASAEAASDIFAEDWARDTGQVLPAATGADTSGAGIGGTMGFKAFSASMLDTAAHWCGEEGDGSERHDPLRVAAFLRGLMRRVARTNEAPVRFRPVEEVREMTRSAGPGVHPVGVTQAGDGGEGEGEGESEGKYDIESEEKKDSGGDDVDASTDLASLQAELHLRRDEALAAATAIPADDGDSGIAETQAVSSSSTGGGGASSAASALVSAARERMLARAQRRADALLGDEKASGTGGGGGASSRVQRKLQEIAARRERREMEMRRAERETRDRIEALMPVATSTAGETKDAHDAAPARAEEKL